MDGISREPKGVCNVPIQELYASEGHIQEQKVKDLPGLFGSGNLTDMVLNVPPDRRGPRPKEKTPRGLEVLAAAVVAVTLKSVQWQRRV